MKNVFWRKVNRRYFYYIIYQTIMQRKKFKRKFFNIVFLAKDRQLTTYELQNNGKLFSTTLQVFIATIRY